MLLFLIARMIYTDGLTAIFTFGGIYGASVFGWGPLELGLFGIILTLVGAFGALIGGWLDDRISAKFVIVSALFILLIGAFGILSVDASHVFYFVDVEPKAPGSAPFSSTGERVFLGFAIVVGLVSAPVQSSSRSLLASLAPRDKITQYFGLFAFSGKVTAFLAPLVVALVTTVTQSQRLGMSAIALFLIAGIALMLPVRSPRARGLVRKPAASHVWSSARAQASALFVEARVTKGVISDEPHPPAARRVSAAARRHAGWRESDGGRRSPGHRGARCSRRARPAGPHRRRSHRRRQGCDQRRHRGR